MCNKLSFITTTLHEHHGVSNHATPLFVELIIRCKSKKTSKLRIIGLCNGNPMAISGFPSQRASNAKNVSIWRRHCYIHFDVLNTSPLTILHIHRVNVTFSFIFQHQGYNAQTHINDIALIQLTQAVIYNRYVQNIQGAVSIRKTVFPGMAIPMLKIRRPNGRLIFNMEIAIRR